MSKIALRLGAFVLVAFLSERAAAQDGRAGEGRAIAQRWCASCHVVDAGGSRSGPAADTVPTFKQIAEAPQTSASYLRAFIQAPHGRMPNLAVTRQEASDLVAYILSLRGR